MRSIPLVAATTVILSLATACGKGSGVTPPPDNTPPTANFTTACNALACTFTNTSTDAEGTFTSSWDFGDQTAVSTDVSPTHTYVTNDVTPYTVKLTVTDQGALTNTKSQDITVSPPATLKCPNGTDCTINLAQKAIVTVTMVSHDCKFTGNAFAITQPIQQMLFTNGCYDVPVGTVYTLNGPNPDKSFSPPTSIQAQFTQGAGRPGDPTKGPPSLRLTQTPGSTTQWTIEIDDGGNAGQPGEPDFNDIILRVDATPAP